VPIASTAVSDPKMARRVTIWRIADLTLKRKQDNKKQKARSARGCHGR
jgi:hypothetical protein